MANLFLCYRLFKLAPIKFVFFGLLHRLLPVYYFDSLRPGCLTHKYVDDTTMIEILSISAVSDMQSFVDELVQQATEAGMIVNGRKTKEMLIGSVLKDPQLSVTLSGTPVERANIQAAGSLCCE